MTLALALEKWSKAGIWVVSRSDTDYPQRLKKLLKKDAPPVLFGCGNVDLLNHPGIAVVGSRDASADDLVFTQALGQSITEQNFVVISGGARGVDDAAMIGALGAGGSAVGVLADSLFRSAISQKYRAALREQRLVLISAFNPEAGFDVGNAMQRNKYIMCFRKLRLLLRQVYVRAERGVGLLKI